MSRNYYHKGVNQKQLLLNASLSPNLVVNGSVTAVQYTYTPPAGFIYEAASLQLIFGDNANIGGTADFFTLAALTNGLLVERRQDGIIVLSVVVRTNLDLLTYAGTKFDERALGSESTLVIETTPFTSFNAILDGDKGDFFRVTVRDNLTALTAGRAVLAGALISK